MDDKPVTRQELQQDLQQALRPMSERMDRFEDAMQQLVRRMDGLDADMQQLERRMYADFDVRESRIVEGLTRAVTHAIAESEARVNARFDERLDRAVTTMLTGFHQYTRTTNVRLSQVESGEAANGTRLASLENRVLEIERRLNLGDLSPGAS